MINIIYLSRHTYIVITDNVRLSHKNERKTI